MTPRASNIAREQVVSTDAIISTDAGSFKEFETMLIFRSQPHPLPGGFAAVFTFDAASAFLGVEWEPTIPSPEARRAGHLRAYRKARNRFLRDVRALTGLRIALVDLGGRQ